MMLPDELDQITSSDIENLVSDEEPESLRLEYKEGRPDRWAGVPTEKSDIIDERKHEFLKDVSGLANARGGYLVYGISESGGQSARPTEAAGFDGWENPDSRIRHLADLTRNYIAPPLKPEFETLSGFENGLVLLVRAPDSWNEPHMVTYNHATDFYIRKNSEVTKMNIDEIRRRAVGRQTVADEMDQFREQRVTQIGNGNTPMPLHGKAFAVAHLFSLPAQRRELNIDVRNVDEPFPLPGSTGWSYRHNAHGFLTYQTNRDDNVVDYVQLFRSGVAEWVANVENNEDVYPSVAIARYVRDFIKESFKRFQTLELAPPYAIYLSLLGLRGYQAQQTPFRSLIGKNTKINQDEIMLPNVLMELDKSNQPTASSLKKVYDLIWQVVGFPEVPKKSLEKLED